MSSLPGGSVTEYDATTHTWRLDCLHHTDGHRCPWTTGGDGWPVEKDILAAYRKHWRDTHESES